MIKWLRLSAPTKTISIADPLDRAIYEIKIQINQLLIMSEGGTTPRWLTETLEPLYKELIRLNALRITPKETPCPKPSP